MEDVDGDVTFKCRMGSLNRTQNKALMMETLSLETVESFVKPLLSVLENDSRRIEK